MKESADPGYKFQVNFEKVFVDGLLKGRRYHAHLRFVTREEAKAFAKRDGTVVAPCAGSSSYRQEDSIIVDLAKFA